MCSTRCIDGCLLFCVECSVFAPYVNETFWAPHPREQSSGVRYSSAYHRFVHAKGYTTKKINDKVWDHRVIDSNPSVQTLKEMSLEVANVDPESWATRKIQSCI
jgi:hypothetical protein